MFHKGPATVLILVRLLVMRLLQPMLRRGSSTGAEDRGLELELYPLCLTIRRLNKVRLPFNAV